MGDIEFAGGIYPKAPQANAPDFVKGQIKIKLSDAIAFLEEKRKLGNEWLDLDIKESKAGKWYASVNTYHDKNVGGVAGVVENSGNSNTDSNINEKNWGDIPF